MVAKRWISVGGYDIRVPVTDIRPSPTPGAGGDSFMQWGASSGAVVGEFLRPWNIAALPTFGNPAVVSIVAPRDCVLRNFMLADTQQTNNGIVEVVVHVEGAPTAVHVFIQPGASVGFEDTTFISNLQRGQLVAVQVLQIADGARILQFQAQMADS